MRVTPLSNPTATSRRRRIRWMMAGFAAWAVALAHPTPAAETPVDGRTELLAPEYRSDITTEKITVEFVNTQGKTAKVYSAKAPAEDTPFALAAKTLVADVTLDDKGKGAFVFPAADFPRGPVALRVDVFGDDPEKSVDTAYFQFFNRVGTPWKAGLANAPVNPMTQGMKLVFADDFSAMPALTVDGKGMGDTGALAPDVPHAYATRKVDGTGMFGWAYFADHNESKYNPFTLVDDGAGNRFMRLTTTYWPEGGVPGANHAWKQKATTGYLSSMGQDGSGFHTQGGRNQYFECRFFLGPNPAHWPAFWLLTANGGVASDGTLAPKFTKASDEIDILEGYLHSPNGYQVTGHQWGYSTGKGRGTWPNVDVEQFGHVNIAMGFHTYAVLITEKMTYYYFDNVNVHAHETMEKSWELGSYFIVNGGLSDHFGLPKEGEDDFGNRPLGFTRYGNACYDYVDWVRVWQDDETTPRFETAKDSLPALPGDYVSIHIDRNVPARALAGQYRVAFPGEGWKIRAPAAANDTAEYVPVNGAAATVDFAPGSTRDALMFMAPAEKIAEGARITVGVTYNGTAYQPGLAVNLRAENARGTEVVVHKNNHPLRGKKGETSGAWRNYDPTRYDDAYFTFEGGWWNEGWSWMHTRSNSDGPVTFAFTGNAFELHHIVWKGGDDYRVYLDGTLMETISSQAKDEKSTLAWRWEDPQNEDRAHTVKIVHVPPGAHEKHIRLDAFKFWRRDDPTQPKYTLAESRFVINTDGPLKPGDTIDIPVDRNIGTGSTYGAYTVTFPEDTAAYGDAGYKVISAASLIQRPRDTIRIQVPSHKDWKGRRDVVILTAPGDAFKKPLRVTVEAPADGKGKK